MQAPGWGTIRRPCPRPTPLIHARGLTKRFGEFTAVDAIDFDVAPGEAFGFLGPERCRQDLDDADDRLRLAGHATATLRVLGMDPAVDGPRIRARLGVVPQQDTLDTELTVRENLVIYGRYFGLPRAECARRADELLEFVQLDGSRQRPGRAAVGRHEAAPDDRPVAHQRARA